MSNIQRMRNIRHVDRYTKAAQGDTAEQIKHAAKWWGVRQMIGAIDDVISLVMRLIVIGLMTYGAYNLWQMFPWSGTG